MYNQRQNSIVGVLTQRELFPRVESENVVDRILVTKFERRKKTPCILADRETSVFGVEFSKDGILLASHVDGLVRVYDSRAQQLICTTSQLHVDACNGCSFIDSNLFASFSDDCHTLIWDLRNTNRSLKALVGHKGWVKNVNVYPGGTKLLTSGIDQTLRIFDIQSPEEFIEAPPTMVFDGLCRVKLSPSGDFLIFTTSKTTVYQIQNLDLDHLGSDIKNYILNFENGNGQPFSKQRNRVQIVHYVPFHNLCSGHSIDISSDELCCLVRHTRSDVVEEGANSNCPEWLSVYDLGLHSDHLSTEVPEDSLESIDYQEDANSDAFVNVGSNAINNNFSVNDFWGESLPLNDQIKVWKAINLSQKVENDLLKNANHTRARLNMLYSTWFDEKVEFGCRPQDLNDAAYYRYSDDFAYGIIKESNFSSNGRLILNPTRFGFEILAYDNKLNSYADSAYNNGTKIPCSATELSVIKDCRIDEGSNCVCLKFSPDDTMIVTGDMEGNISWFSPFQLK